MLADARVSGSKACVADLGSQHGTSVQRDGIAIKMAPFQLFALQKGDELVFGASSRRYRVKVETGRTETKRDALYLKLAEPNAAKPDAEKRTVRVGNVAYEATEQEIESLFTADGSTTVIDVVLPRELRPRGPFFFGKERRSIDTICLFFSLLRVPARARSSRSEPSEFGARLFSSLSRACSMSAGDEPPQHSHSAPDAPKPVGRHRGFAFVVRHPRFPDASSAPFRGGSARARFEAWVP